MKKILGMLLVGGAVAPAFGEKVNVKVGVFGGAVRSTVQKGASIKVYELLRSKRDHGAVEATGVNAVTAGVFPGKKSASGFSGGVFTDVYVDQGNKMFGIFAALAYQKCDIKQKNTAGYAISKTTAAMPALMFGPSIGLNMKKFYVKGSLLAHVMQRKYAAGQTIPASVHKGKYLYSEKTELMSSIAPMVLFNVGYACCKDVSLEASVGYVFPRNMTLKKDLAKKYKTGSNVAIAPGRIIGNTLKTGGTFMFNVGLSYKVA